MNLEKKKSFIIDFIYFAFWLAIVFISFRFVLEYFLPFFVGVVVAYFVQKPATYISLKCKIKKEMISAILSVIFFIAIIVLITFLIWFLVIQITKLFDYMNTNINVIERIFTDISLKFNKMFEKTNSKYKHFFMEFSKEIIQTSVTKLGGLLSSIMSDLFKKIPAFFVGSVITVVATCYIARDYDMLKAFFGGIISKKNIKTIIDIRNIVTECFFKFIFGYFKIFIITFIQLLLGLLIIGNKNFIALSLIIALLDLLPVLGTGTVLLPWALINFLLGNVFKGIGLVVLYLCITIIRNYIEPKIMGKQIEINPLFMLVFIFLGFKIGGLLGMLFFPLLLTVVFTYFRRKYTDTF